MNAYTIGLFFHFLGLIVLFGAFVLSIHSGRQLRRATQMDAALVALALGRAAGPMFPIGSLLLLLSGLHLTGMQWSFQAPWVATAIAGVVAFSIVGGRTGRARGQRLGMLAAGKTGGIPPELAEEIRKAGPETTSAALGGGALGILWIMATKPGWPGSIGAVVGGMLVGGLLGSMLLRRGTKA